MKILEREKCIRLQNYELHVKNKPIVNWFLSTNSYSSFKERRLYNPWDWLKTKIINNVIVRKRAILRTSSICFIWFLLFSEFLDPHKNVIKKSERQKSTNEENWISSSLLALLQGKIMFNWTNNHLGFSISLLNRPLRSGLNKFAKDPCGLVPVVLTQWVCHCCTLNNFYKKVGDQLPAKLQH